MNTKIEDMDNKDSYLNYLDDDDKEKSHSHFEELDWFKGVQRGAPNQRIATK